MWKRSWSTGEVGAPPLKLFGFGDHRADRKNTRRPRIKLHSKAQRCCAAEREMGGNVTHTCTEGLCSSPCEASTVPKAWTRRRTESPSVFATARQEPVSLQAASNMWCEPEREEAVCLSTAARFTRCLRRTCEVGRLSGATRGTELLFFGLMQRRQQQRALNSLPYKHTYIKRRWLGYNQNQR